MIYRFISSLKR